MNQLLNSPPPHLIYGEYVSQSYDEITIVSHNSITALQRLLNSSDKAFPACATTKCAYGIELVYSCQDWNNKGHILLETPWRQFEGSL